MFAAKSRRHEGGEKTEPSLVFRNRKAHRSIATYNVKLSAAKIVVQCNSSRARCSLSRWNKTKIKKWLKLRSGPGSFRLRPCPYVWAPASSTARGSDRLLNLSISLTPPLSIFLHPSLEPPLYFSIPLSISLPLSLFLSLSLSPLFFSFLNRSLT